MTETSSTISRVIIRREDIVKADDTIETVLNKRRPFLESYWSLIKQEWDTLLNISEYIEENIEIYGPIFPSRERIFRALEITPLTHVKVVIILQDPYHDLDIKGRIKAQGIALSMGRDLDPSPSMKTVYKELKNCYPDYVIPNHGCLEEWAKQGVLLLNSRLTVHQGQPTVANKFWNGFVDSLVEHIAVHRPKTIFAVWGAKAKNDLKASLSKCNYVLEAAHPSPVNTRGGFLGCEHFKKINIQLIESKMNPIDWIITP